jgi:hypothetical protein
MDFLTNHRYKKPEVIIDCFAFPAKVNSHSLIRSFYLIGFLLKHNL